MNDAVQRDPDPDGALRDERCNLLAVQAFVVTQVNQLPLTRVRLQSVEAVAQCLHFRPIDAFFVCGNAIQPQSMLGVVFPVLMLAGKSLQFGPDKIPSNGP